jgi:hypothetical protein
VHQSGVNCLDAVVLKTSEIFVVSGGDDQAVSVLRVPAGDWGVPKVLSAIYWLLLVVCYLLFAVCCLPSAVCRLPSAVNL